MAVHFWTPNRSRTGRGALARLALLVRLGLALAVTLGSLVIVGAPAAHALNQPVVGIAATPDRGGYWLVARDGGVFSFGNASFHGSTASIPLNAPIVGMAPTPTGAGYWLAAADGGVFAFGDAIFLGSMAGQPLNKPVVGMAATPTGAGYWLVGADGGVYAFGDAPFRGSMGGQPLNKPVVGMAATSNGQGYWLVASDGGIFAFNAPFYGSMGGQPLNKPMVGMAARSDGGGYWLVASDGGIFAFSAGFYGSTGSISLNQPVVGIAGGPGNGGYWMGAADGGVFAFGSAPFRGSMVSGEPATGNTTPPATSLRSAIVNRAAQHVGYNTPSENTHNFTPSGNYVTRRWCGDFASYVWIRSGVTDWIWLPAVKDWRPRAESLGRFRGRDSHPEIGDVAIWLGSGNSHVNIVIDVRGDGWIRTIGGNEGPDTVVRATSFFNPRTARSGSLIGYAMPVSPGTRPSSPSSQSFASPAEEEGNGFLPEVSVSDVTVGEGGVAFFTVSATFGVSYPWSVTYSTLDGTALSLAGLDYTAQSGTLAFNNGEQSRVIAVSTTNDALPEVTETFSLTIASVDDVQLSDTVGAGTIIDNDPLPVA